MAPMKLYYFNMAGRAQPIRYALEAGKVEYEDIRFTKDEWKNEFKSKSPSGQCPFFQFEDESIMTESVAMLLYSCQKANNGSMPSCSRALGCGLMMIQMFDTCKAATLHHFTLPTEEEKIKNGPILMATLMKKLELMYAMYKSAFPKKTGNYLFGEVPSFADFYIANVVEQMALSSFFSANVELADMEKSVSEFVTATKAVWDIPQIKSYKEKNKMC